ILCDPVIPAAFCILSACVHTAPVAQSGKTSAAHYFPLPSLSQQPPVNLQFC
ncbi:hypothetical protein AMECASPLE_032196, partial [Ameca splendens]